MKFILPILSWNLYLYFKNNLTKIIRLMSPKLIITIIYITRKHYFSDMVTKMLQLEQIFKKYEVRKYLSSNLSLFIFQFTVTNETFLNDSVLCHILGWRRRMQGLHCLRSCQCWASCRKRTNRSKGPWTLQRHHVSKFAA